MGESKAVNDGGKGGTKEEFRRHYDNNETGEGTE